MAAFGATEELEVELEVRIGVEWGRRVISIVRSRTMRLLSMRLFVKAHNRPAASRFYSRYVTNVSFITC